MPDTIHSVTCPQATRTKNHRKRLHKWWESKEWKAHVKEKTAGKVCAMCKCVAGQVKGERKPAVLTINHLYRNLYNDLEEYMKFEDGHVEIACTTCNWMFEKGMDVCPACLSDTVAKYKQFRQPVCPACFHKAHPEIKELQKKKADATKALKKKLNDEAKAKAKQLRKEYEERQRKEYELHKLKESCKRLTYKDWKAKKIADGTWEERNIGGWT